MITAYVKERRWFRAKARGLVDAKIDEAFPLRLDGEEVMLCIVACTYADGGSDHYVLPIATATDREADRLRKEEPHLIIGDVTPSALRDLGFSADQRQKSDRGILYDALGSKRLLSALLREFRDGGRRVEGERGTLVFQPFPELDAAVGANFADAGDITPRPTKTEQTNTSIVFGDTFILKIVRKLDDGTSAELEMGAFLTQHGHASSPQVVGAIEIERPEQEASTVGILHRFVANEGDAWTSTSKDLAASRSAESYLPRATLLGKRVGEMHVVLAAGTDPTFAVEPLGRERRVELANAVKAEARALAQWLRSGDEERLEPCVDAFVELAEDPPLMRIHGDLHLGQILATGDDFVLIDFEGEPARSLAARKAKRSPLADVAGMLRSFDYAAGAALRANDSTRSASSKPWTAEDAREWYRAVADAFIAAYRSATGGCEALRTADETFRKSLDFYLLEKSLYELAYEANNRPDWIAIPQDGIRNLLDGATGQ